jgi:hypothetical protein
MSAVVQTRIWLSLALVTAAACGEPDAAVGSALPAFSPEATCAAGERPVAGAGADACTPVGTTSVPAGFVAAPWGFAPVAPAVPCTGATIARLGQDACEPIDDCNAPFPPAEAKVAVRKNGAPYPGRSDLVVVATLSEALAQAGNGTVIAIDEGEFEGFTSIARPVRFVGRCAEKTSLHAADFVARIEGPLHVGFQSLSLTGASKVALLANSHATVSLDRVYVHGPGSGAQAGNGALLEAKRTVFEGPAVAPNPGAATNGVYAIYGGKVAFDGVELRGFQNSILAQSVGTDVRLVNSLVHEQVALDADPTALAQVGAFVGASVTIEASHVESAPGRIAIVGAARLDGTPDRTSSGDPPAKMTVKNSSLVHGTLPRETQSAIDTLAGATLDLDNVSLRHDAYVAIGADEGSAVALRNSVIQAGASARNARIALSATKRGGFTVESSALVGSTQFAIVLDGGSTASLTGSLISGNREIGIVDATKFFGAAQAVAVGRDGKATLSDSAFVDNEGTAVFLQEATLQVDGIVLAGTHASSFGRSGVGITAIDSVVAVRTSTIRRNGVALAVRGGRALLSESAVTDHADAIQLDHVTFVQTDESRDAADLQVLAARTTFARNTRLVTEHALTSE